MLWFARASWMQSRVNWLKWSSSFLWIGLLLACTVEAAEDETLEQRALDMSAIVSDQVQYVGKNVDLFLTGGRVYTETRNTTSVTVSQMLGLTEGGVLTNSTNFGFNLRLPNFEKRWQLRFSTYDEDEEDR